MSVSSAVTQSGALGIPFAVSEGAHNLQVRNITTSTFEVHFVPPAARALTFYTAVAQARDYSYPDVNAVIGQDGYVSNEDYVARFSGLVSGVAYTIIFRTYNATGIYEAPHLEATTEVAGAPTACVLSPSPWELSPTKLIVPFLPSTPIGASSYVGQGISAAIGVTPLLNITSTDFISGYDATHDAMVFTIAAAIPPGYANDDAWDITIDATNSSGTTTSLSVQSQVIVVPGVPTAPTLGTIQKGSTTLTIPITGGGVGADSWAAGVVGQISGQPEGTVRVTPPNAITPTGSVSVTGLTPNTAYLVTVTATNTVGSTTQVGAPTVTTTDEFPPKPVNAATIVPFGTQSPNDLWWCWKETPGDATHGPPSTWIASARIGSVSLTAQQLANGVSSQLYNVPADFVYAPGVGPNPVAGYVTANWVNIPAEAQTPNSQVAVTVAQVNGTGETSIQQTGVPKKNDQTYPVPT